MAKIWLWRLFYLKRQWRIQKLWFHRRKKGKGINLYWDSRWARGIHRRGRQERCTRWFWYEDHTNQRNARIRETDRLFQSTRLAGRIRIGLLALGSNLFGQFSSRKINRSLHQDENHRLRPQASVLGLLKRQTSIETWLYSLREWLCCWIQTSHAKG